MPEITAANRITLPADALSAASIVPGDEVRLHEGGSGRILIVKESRESGSQFGHPLSAYSVVSREGRVTIPELVLKQAGVVPGDHVLVRAIGPGEIEMLRSQELIDRFAGAFGEDVYPPGYLDEVRRGWE